jgi:hypothetical protein
MVLTMSPYLYSNWLEEIATAKHTQYYGSCFMLNDTTAFFRWVFLEALPLLLGEENLCRVKLILSDDASQEFNAINEGIFQVFKDA